MSDLLDPSAKENMQQVNQQLGDLITEMDDGKQNDGLFFSIGQNLATLSQNEDIPAHVKLKLQAALQDIQNQSFNNLDVTKIMAAKKEVDDALGGSK